MEGVGDAFDDFAYQRGFLIGEGFENVLDPVVGGFGFANSDADAREFVGAQQFDDRGHALMSGGATAGSDADDAEGEVHFIVDDGQIGGSRTEAGEEVADRVAAVVHEGAGLGENDGPTFDFALAEGGVLAAV